MSELAKAYEPSQVEDRLYSQWKDRGDWTANPASSKPAYSIVMPPPNITGVLTLGHVLNNTIQDILCRKARMEGKEVLWLPGTDHAGLATQTAVEKHLRKTENKTRNDLGRDEFLRRTWEWQEKHGSIILQQLQKIGCSADWSRLRFTMDDAYSKEVQTVFIDLFQKGCIHRGLRMVNWCPGSLTAISDEEVIPKAQKGLLFTMKYEVAEEPGTFIEISTTRPETIMGDTAVAVKPGGKWARLIGKHVWRPFPREKIPIIADEAVDEAFGTGALKVTPAHDKVDFEIGQRHQLPIIEILTPNGKINCPSVPELHGLDRFEARKKATELLKEKELLIKEEPYENNVGFSERADVPIEPRLSLQWFLDYKKMLGGKMIPEALRVVREHLIRIYPDHWEKVYGHWLENIQEWCLSRQVWWGHRLPVWYRTKGTSHALDLSQPRTMKELAELIASQVEVKCQPESPGADWTQDDDTLDTWASSWLWAYATMDAPTRKKFYPTSVLVTGPDIIFLWVARMIIAGLEYQPSGTPTSEANIAFADVYFTGLIRDKQGRKMSKSLGNSPDTLEIIAKYGADGLRFGLMRMAPQGQDIRFDEKQIEEGRNFCNKLWNASRFRAMQGPLDAKADPSKHALTPFASLLLHKLQNTVSRYHTALDAYEFNQAANALYDFVWNDFCSNFIEAAKGDFQKADSPTRAGTLASIDYTLSVVLRLLHPYAPFVTEELWLMLGLGESTIQFASLPRTIEIPLDKASVNRAQAVYESVDLGRGLRGEFNLPSNQKIPFQTRFKTPLTDSEKEVLSLLLNASALDPVETAPAKTPMVFTPLGELFLPLAGLVDPEQEKKRLEKELQKLSKDIELTQKKLSDPNMIQKAPPEKVTEWKQALETLAQKQKRLTEQMEML